jgi:EpsI family protein
VTARQAGLVVCALLAVAAAVSFAIGDGTARLLGTVRLPRPLAQAVPLDLAGWKGVDEPIDEAVIRITKIDDHVRRRYRAADGAAVMLYVGYHGNKQRGMDTLYHNPTICFPAQGWKPVGERTGIETLPRSAREIPVCRYVFARADTRASVLTFFKVGGELLDQSPRNKWFWTLVDRATPQLDDSPGTFVQVQVLTEIGRDGEAAAANVQSRFLRDFGEAILAAVETEGAR